MRTVSTQAVTYLVGFGQPFSSNRFYCFCFVTLLWAIFICNIYVFSFHCWPKSTQPNLSNLHTFARINSTERTGMRPQNKKQGKGTKVKFQFWYYEFYCLSIYPFWLLLLNLSHLTRILQCAKQCVFHRNLSEV